MSATAAVGRSTAEPALKSETSEIKTSWAGRVPQIKPGRYPDGMPFHEIEYLACKLVLRPNRFTSRKSLFDFANVLIAPAAQCGVQFLKFKNAPLKIREVLFIDTRDFRLYNNAFILRRRIPYTDGFPSGEPEIVFKFRHPDIQRAAETDVRPQILGDHRVKFKCQALPLKDQLGGIRLLYSHNVQFPRSHVGETRTDIFLFETIAKIFPVLHHLKTSPDEKFELVNDTIIEEVLQDIGSIDFGSGLSAKTNVGIWRTRGEHRPLIGEFAFQIRFGDRKVLTLDAMQRAERFFIALQHAARDYISLNATKTGVVYRLLGNAPTAHE